MYCHINWNRDSSSNLRQYIQATQNSNHMLYRSFRFLPSRRTSKKEQETNKNTHDSNLRTWFPKQGWPFVPALGGHVARERHLACGDFMSYSWKLWPMRLSIKFEKTILHVKVPVAWPTPQNCSSALHFKGWLHLKKQPITCQNSYASGHSRIENGSIQQKASTRFREAHARYTTKHSITFSYKAKACCNFSLVASVFCVSCLFSMLF